MSRELNWSSSVGRPLESAGLQAEQFSGQRPDTNQWLCGTQPSGALRLLVAEDDPISLRMLTTTLRKWGHEVISVADGLSAWDILRGDDAPELAVLDWMMPGMDGTQVCSAIRSQQRELPPYLIILTARDRAEDIVAGLGSGADDYITKPFDRQELRARIEVGARVLSLQRDLSARVHELEDALAHVKQLQLILPMCSYCKRIRDDGDYWQEVESYISAHTDTEFSHGICPECLERVVTEYRADRERSTDGR